MGERDLITLKGKFSQLDNKTALENLQAEILELGEQEIRLLIADASTRLTEVLDVINNIHGKAAQVTIQQANLESLFIKLTGRALRDAS